MSDYIPFEIQLEIIKRLPAKSLIQFRSVSKTWKSHIESSDFIARYKSQQHLFVSYVDLVTKDRKCVSIEDDDTSPQHKVSHSLPWVAELIGRGLIVGSSHGLLCLYDDDGPSSGSGMAFLLNFLIRKVVRIVVPDVGVRGIDGPILGFGVCPKTNDPMIVKVRHINNRYRESIVEVFTLSSGAWRSPRSGNLPRKSIWFDYDSEVIDGSLYWAAASTTSKHTYNLIISFDMTSDREMNLPDSLAILEHDDQHLCISKVNESLVVLAHDVVYRYFDVWMMEDGVLRTFKKLYSISISPGVFWVFGFRKSGEPIIELDKHPRKKLESEASSLLVYKPYTKQIDSLGIDGIGVSFTFGVYPYVETLVLLDQPDSVIYDNGKNYISKWSAKKRGLWEQPLMFRPCY